MKKIPILFAIFAAVCYGISVPLAKLLLANMPPVLLAALLYLGAGIGMLILSLVIKKKDAFLEAKITIKELPFTIAMVILDIAAPIFLMFGLSMTNSETTALLNNFEIVATTVVALVVFKEAVGKRMGIAIILITAASILLTVENYGELKFSSGSLFVLAACVCWGIENNCTRMLSLKNPLHIVVIKGIGSGLGSLLIAIFVGGFSLNVLYIVITLLLGFVAYGLSIYFYILATLSQCGTHKCVLCRSAIYRGWTFFYDF